MWIVGGWAGELVEPLPHKHKYSQSIFTTRKNPKMVKVDVGMGDIYTI